MRLNVSLAAMVLCSVCSHSSAAEFYAIESVSASTGETDLWPASNLIQGPGVGFDAEDPHAKLISGADGNWVTAADAGFPSDYIEQVGKPVITLDLGADVELGEVSAWGYDSSNANGVSSFSLKFATEADGPDGFGSSISFNPTYFLGNDDTNARQSNLFGEVVTARYVEFTTEDNFFVAPGDGSGGELAGGDRAGFGEIGFQVVPEPTSGCLIITALIGILGLRRRR